MIQQGTLANDVHLFALQFLVTYFSVKIKNIYIQSHTFAFFVDSYIEIH